MDYENFKEQIVEEVKSGLYEKGFEVNVTTQHVDKLNDGYDAMTITPADSNIGMNINISQLYEQMENGRDFAEVSHMAVETAATHLEDMPVVDVAQLTDYEQMKGKLAIEVVSLEANADMLSKIPHQEMEDMAVVYRFVLGSDAEGRSSILVTNNLIENMGVTPEQLHADAIANAPEIRPAEIKGMSQVMMEMMGPEQFELMGMPMVTDLRDEQMIVASVPDKTGGAGVIAYPNFMEDVAAQVGGEITGLRWCDIDLEEEVINVNHTLVYYCTRTEAGQIFAINTTKTKAGERTIPMLPIVKEAFLMEKVYQEECGIKSEAVVDGYRDFIFVNRFGNVQHQGTLNKALRRIIRDCNFEVLDKDHRDNAVILPKFSNHSLRHTFTTRMCEAGVNIKAMQDILGHADAETTMQIYAEATKDLKKSELINFEDYFAKQKKAQSGNLQVATLRPICD